MSTGFKREVRIANILTAIFLNNYDFTKGKRLLEPAAILTSKLIILTKKQHARNWSCYSESKGRLFCFSCKVMACSDSKPQNKLVEEGFNDWKSASNLLRKHEESNSHQQHLIELLMRKKAVVAWIPC